MCPKFGYPANGHAYSHPQIDGKVNHHQISRDLLFHLFGDDYSIHMFTVFYCNGGKSSTNFDQCEDAHETAVPDPKSLILRQLPRMN